MCNTPKYVQAYIYNVRMLHERGNGCGTTRRTVVHAKLTGDLQSGRLSRKSGQLLCRGNSTPFDNEIEFNTDPGTVTCPRCLKMIALHNLLHDSEWQNREDALQQARIVASEKRAEAARIEREKNPPPPIDPSKLSGFELQIYRLMEKTVAEDD